MITHEIFKRSDLLTQSMIEIINHPAYDNSPRISVSGNLCQISIEHACAFRALSENRMFASGFVVLRAQFEAVVRAVWAFYCASDAHISKISQELNIDSEQAAKNLPQVHDMLSSLASVSAAKVPYEALTEFKDNAWKALNSYTHAGIHPLNRMIDGYPLEFVISNIKISNALAMIASMQFCILTGIVGLQNNLTPLHDIFRDCLPSHKAVT